MIKREDVLSLGYLKKAPFRGSYRGMRFLMQKLEAEDQKFLQVFAWPEPYAFDQTPDEQKTECRLEFSEKGIVQAVDWLNQMWEGIKE